MTKRKRTPEEILRRLRQVRKIIHAGEEAKAEANELYIEGDSAGLTAPAMARAMEPKGEADTVRYLAERVRQVIREHRKSRSAA